MGLSEQDTRSKLIDPVLYLIAGSAEEMGEVRTDVDCKDVAYQNFRVLPPDPHKFGGKNKDGISPTSHSLEKFSKPYRDIIMQ